ncbi:hypothetical protein K458DRAFT_431126 [Lentithecium fluviatile CBS 122367]|uniref:Uncharacterized protein n=1 Tax=Lentithecium fluviatile CBS 122367 TaxID=1168545 RepID=A0A6G1J3Q7_9PLEO|nr:hypothetical protein K458DRAFT_431126 [Lentithecium fluviatile CBS 122367]
MQNYGQQQPGYQRPGSVASFTGAAAPPPPPYGGQQGYQSAAPQAQSQWAAPAQNQPAQQQQQWNQPQQVAGGYNPGLYGAMPGAYSQGQQAPNQTSTVYPHQQQDMPPPPPPKPAGFAAAQEQQQQPNTQNWGQQPAYGAQQTSQSYQTPQQNTGFAQGQQGGHQNQGAQQQPYNTAAPPPPSQTPGGSYFPPTQTPQQGRPGSIYGADQAGVYSSPASAVAQQPPQSVLSPNEQQPAYIPPSLTGQGVQSYMPANTNPMPGVYIPPPPDIPAWQQAQHAPLQGGKKFKYTKPTVDPSFYAQGYQSVQPVQQQGQLGQQPVQPQQNPQQFGQPVQNQFQPQIQPQVQQQQVQFGQPAQNQFPQGQPQQQGQFGQPVQAQQNQYNQPVQQQTQLPQQTPPQYNQSQYGQPNQSPQQPQNQWQPTSVDQGFVQQQQGVPAPYNAQQPVQQQAWQPGHQAQGSIAGQQYPQGQGQEIQAPKPVGQSGSTPPGFINQPSPQSTPVSPLQHRQSVSYGSTQSQTGLGRTGSVSSIALGAIHAQRAGNRTSSPKPPPPKIPTPPPPRDDKSKYSALGMGGPSDWELPLFGPGEEIDDEELFAPKKETKQNETSHSDSVELPAAVPSPPPTQGDWPSPASQTAPLNLRGHDSYQPTPPKSGTPVPRPASEAPQQGFVMGDVPPTQQPQQGFVMGDAPPQQPQQSFLKGDAPPQQPQQSFVMGDALPPQQPQQSFVMGDAPPPQQPQRGFVMGDAPPQQSFVMGDATITPPKSTQTPQPAQQTQPPSAPPPATQQGFVVDDGGGWAAQSTPGTPAQAQQHRPANTSFVMGEGSWGTSEQTPTQATGGWGTQPSPAHVAELKAKDEAYERLKVDTEKGNADIRAELNKLSVALETAKKHADSERDVLIEQIDTLKATAAQAKIGTDASNREKTLEIERLKEDAEGKDDAIKEKEATIAELRKQLQDNNGAMVELRKQLEEKDSTIATFQQQLDAANAKEAPKPAPADLVPDIDPWYASSLERYIAMLRSEAFEPAVEDKIKAFTSFLKSESGIRGIEYYSAPPPAPAVQEHAPQHLEQNVGPSRGTSNASIDRRSLNVEVPPASQEPLEDDYEYSPGGRPRLKSTIKSDELIPNRQSFSMTGEPSVHSTTVYTPTSSQDEDFNKTPTPMQSPPEEQQQPVYKPYVPPSINQESSANLLHRQSMSFVPTAPVAPLHTSGSGKNIDEIFFDSNAPDSSTKAAGRPTASTSISSDVAVPPALFTSQTSVAAATPAPASSKDPLDALVDVVPDQVAISTNSELEGIRKKLSDFSSDFSFIQETTSTWERAAALARKKNDDARRKRQEESEANTDELFNDNQISYADIGAIEDEFKEKERELKAQEDRDEYKTYVESVFDKVYDDLQSQIKSLMDLYIEVETLVQTSVSGVKSLEGGDVVSTIESLKLLKELHGLIEARHEKVVLAVAERDRRYKKTEIQPLYAAGNISKMKNVEKHFENAEKQAVVRAKSEKMERVDGLVRVAEEVVVGAVGVEQGEIDRILAAIRDLHEKSDEELLTRARETLLALKGSSKSLLELFNSFEIELNAAVIETDIAQARAENAPADRIKDLEKEMAEGEKKAKDEFLRRVQVIDQDKEEIDRLIEEKGGKAVLSEEEEKKVRMQRALEEAKRRNGDL